MSETIPTPTDSTAPDSSDESDTELAEEMMAAMERQLAQIEADGEAVQKLIGAAMLRNRYEADRVQALQAALQQYFATQQEELNGSITIDAAVAMWLELVSIIRRLNDEPPVTIGSDEESPDDAESAVDPQMGIAGPDSGSATDDDEPEADVPRGRAFQ
jgi:hypothetical protein